MFKIKVWQTLIFSVFLWSFPFLPGTYSSPSPYLCLIYLVIAIYHGNYAALIRIRQKSIIYLCAVLFVFLFSFVNGVVDNGRFLVNLCFYLIGFSSFYAFDAVFKLHGNAKVVSFLVKASKVIAFFAIIEFSMIIFNLSWVKTFVNVVVTGDSSARILITTNEPSWAVQLIMFCSCFIVHDFYNNKNYLSFFLIIFLIIIFFASFSMTGFFVLFFACLFYIVFFTNLFSYSSLKIIIFIVAFLCLTMIIYKFVDNDGSYIYSRVDKFLALDIDELSLSKLYWMVISVDNSLLVRFGYPVVAFNMLLEHPLGVGIGGFSQNFYQYFYLLDTKQVLTSEVVEHIQNVNADPRNFFLRVGVEFGWVGLVALLFYIFSLAYKLKFYQRSSGVTLNKSLFCLALGMMMQFSTFYFSPYWLILALLVNSLSSQMQIDRSLNGKH